MLIEFTNKGMFVPIANVYIDPWTAVPKALITHAHSDHARVGSGSYLSHYQSIPILQKRLGNQDFMGINYKETIQINGVNFTFYPAGHVLGSAQIKVEYKGEVWVASGDYKLENDGVSAPFESVKCHTFITESTFGLPVYKWQSQLEIFTEINDWWQQNITDGKCSVILAYSLGKAQRILQNVNIELGPVFVHGAVDEMNKAHSDANVQLNNTTRITPELNKTSFKNALIIAPPAVEGSAWLKKMEPYSLAVASGWMGLRGVRKRMNADLGFVLSDHADWDGLNLAVKNSGAENILVTHGFTAIFSKWLTEEGYNANEVNTKFSGESLTETEN
jgi:putative mRNA 3-end processing factor